MSEKQNKMPGWKEDFLQWERSGAPANDMPWGKLQARLQPNRKKALIYLLPAAAVLILVFGLFYLFFSANKQAIEPTAKKFELPTKTPAPVVKAPIESSNPLKESLPQKENHRPLKKITVDTNKKDELVLSTQEIILPVTVTPTEQRQLTADTLKPIIAEAPKKKLKVVHMNEWNSPPPPTYAAIKEAWEREKKRLQQEDNISMPNKRWSIFSPRN